jgi:hypothetical protein
MPAPKANQATLITERKKASTLRKVRENIILRQ